MENLDYFRLAKKINDVNIETLRDRNIHCRGNIKSMSLISISSKKPETGFSAIKSEQGMINKIEKWEDIKEPGRCTPEKSLQAWIIKNAMENKSHYLPFGDNLKFVTSEMALPNENKEILNKDKKRIVNDILAYNEKGGLFIIELKSDRTLTKLIEQVSDFEEVVINKSNLFAELLEIHDCKNWDKKSIKKIIVWPYSSRGSKSTEKLTTENIIEYGYDKNADESFSFKLMN